MVRALDGVVIYFDPQTIAQCYALGYTAEQYPAYRIIYKNGTAEDMIDAWSVMYNALKR